MSARGDRLLAAVLASAGAQLAADQQLGQLVWAVDGTRCYQRWDGAMGRITITCLQAGTTVYELPGISPADLI